eukprot:5622319-Pyramimonas_sp.AAC.1
MVCMADSARAEQLAGEMLMYEEESSMGCAEVDGFLLTNLRKVGQDKPHGVRRTLGDKTTENR